MMKEIDIAKSYGNKCDECNTKFEDSKIIYEFLDITKYDTYSDNYDENELLFCSKECLMEYILRSENLTEHTVKLINSKSDDILAKKNEIRETIMGLVPGEITKIENIVITSMYIDNENRYLICNNNKTDERIYSFKYVLNRIYDILKLNI